MGDQQAARLKALDFVDKWSDNAQPFNACRRSKGMGQKEWRRLPARNSIPKQVAVARPQSQFKGLPVEFPAQSGSGAAREFAGETSRRRAHER
eukprot:4373807-Pyramimonas_sp.AAC.1